MNGKFSIQHVHCHELPKDGHNTTYMTFGGPLELPHSRTLSAGSICACVRDYRENSDLLAAGIISSGGCVKIPIGSLELKSLPSLLWLTWFNAVTYRNVIHAEHSGTHAYTG